VRFYSVAAECRHMGGCGCRAAECCFACPLARCLLEKEQGVSRRHLLQRNEYIRKFRKAGLRIGQLVGASGLTSQSIYRILRHA
jgi:hypothetical protein